MNVKITEGDVVNKLKELGDIPVVKLREMNIKGDHNCEDCPIGRYLKGAFPDLFPGVCKYNISLYTDETKRYRVVSITTPAAIAVFINLFDNGYYPELEEEWIQ